MANVFTRSNEATSTPNRNTFDGSFVNNLTLKMGQITPCFLKEVIPGDSFKIDATFGFNFQPMVFPVQTDMQANLHFFYVRNRALWDGWQDFITKTNNYDAEENIPPYILLTDENRDMFNTGSIGDYLGIPTVYYGQGARTIQSVMNMFNPADRKLYYLNPSKLSDWDLKFDINPNWSDMDKTGQIAALLWSGGLAPNNSNIPTLDTYYQEGNVPVFAADVPARTTNLLSVIPTVIGDPEFVRYMNTSARTGQVFAVRRVSDGNIVAAAYSLASDLSDYTAVSGTSQAYIVPSSAPTVKIDNLDPEERYQVIIFTHGIFTTASSSSASYAMNNSKLYYPVIDEVLGIPNSDRSLSDLPFASEANPNGLRISALPFRAVEACYNSFYRDSRNNPLMINGKPYYNIYAVNTAGSGDDTHYHLYQRNWEQDVFTTAVQSPQQGVAPLVGVTASGEMTFQDEEGKSYYLQAEFAEDGHTITGIKSYSSDMPVGTLRAMVDTISTGISINDFRNVNALQRWLETNMRKGLRYKDQIEAHFGVAPTYSELDIPEFIGGMSRSVAMNKVVQTSSSTSDSPLGSLGGSASVLGDGGSSVTKYVDEHGWIIGFITISPKPVYSQQLNKQLLKTELLDYYFPEFAHIGYQPILNQEIAPLQCTVETGKRLQDVFGYQRAWYEYLSSQDEVHGDFRTNMRDFLINRTYKDVPQLGEQFLTISTDEADDVFAIRDDDSDKIFGQIYFDVKMKRPIPAIGTPKLEVG